MTQGRMSTRMICRDTITHVNKRLHEFVTLKKELLNYLHKTIGPDDNAIQTKDLNQACLNELYQLDFEYVQPDCTVEDLKNFFNLDPVVNELISETQKYFFTAFIVMIQHDLLDKDTPFKKFFEDCVITYEQDHPEIKAQENSLTTIATLDRALRKNCLPELSQMQSIAIQLLKQLIKSTIQKNKMISKKWQIYKEYFLDINTLPKENLSEKQKIFYNAYACSPHNSMQGFFLRLYTEAEKRLHQEELELKKQEELISTKLEEKAKQPDLKKSAPHSRIFKPATSKPLTSQSSSEIKPRTETYNAALYVVATSIIPDANINKNYNKMLTVPALKRTFQITAAHQNIQKVYDDKQVAKHIPDGTDKILRAFLQSDKKTLGEFYRMLYKDALEACKADRSRNTLKI